MMSKLKETNDLMKNISKRENDIKKDIKNDIKNKKVSLGFIIINVLLISSFVILDYLWLKELFMSESISMLILNFLIFVLNTLFIIYLMVNLRSEYKKYILLGTYVYDDFISLGKVLGLKEFVRGTRDDVLKDQKKELGSAIEKNKESDISIKSTKKKVGRPVGRPKKKVGRPVGRPKKKVGRPKKVEKTGRPVGRPKKKVGRPKKVEKTGRPVGRPTKKKVGRPKGSKTRPLDIY